MMNSVGDAKSDF
jgi:hypothetical protein